MIVIDTKTFKLGIQTTEIWHLYNIWLPQIHKYSVGFLICETLFMSWLCVFKWFLDFFFFPLDKLSNKDLLLILICIPRKMCYIFKQTRTLHNIVLSILLTLNKLMSKHFKFVKIFKNQTMLVYTEKNYTISSTF